MSGTKAHIPGVIAIAVGVVVSVCPVKTGNAANTQSVNTSEGYVSMPTANAFVTAFVNEGCQNMAGSTAPGPGCGVQAQYAVTAAAGLTGAVNPGGATINQYFANANLMPVLDGSVFSAGMQNSGWNNAVPFANGIFDVLDVTNGIRDNTATGNTTALAYFSGLMNSWSNAAAAATAGDRPIGAPTRGAFGATVTERQLWIDQTVVAYIVSTTGTDGLTGTDDFIQNFQTQLAWSGSDLATSLAQTDGRLEQQVALDTVNGIPFIATQQTLQSAVQTLGTLPNTTPDPSVGSGAAAPLPNGAGVAVGQLVSQDIEGWFLTCVNCDSSSVPTALHFGALPLVRFQPYGNEFLRTPTIIHGTNISF